MAGEVAPFRFALIGDDLRHGNTLRGAQRKLGQSLGKRTLSGGSGEDRILSPVGTSFRGSCCIRIRKIFRDEFRAGALSVHARGAYGNRSEETHARPSWMAERRLFSFPRRSCVARLNCIVFSERSLASRSMLTLLPSFLAASPETSTTES